QRGKMVDSETSLVVERGRALALIDAGLSSLARYTWRMDRNGYVYRKRSGKRVYLHHVVCGKPADGMVTDHINRNKLDNRAFNLRHIPRSVSQQNVGAQRRNASGLRGAHWDRANGKWKAFARKGGV